MRTSPDFGVIYHCFLLVESPRPTDERDGCNGEKSIERTPQSWEFLFMVPPNASTEGSTCVKVDQTSDGNNKP